ncbi:adenosylcobinamide-GDP ribazoletransferase [Shewanella sp. GXUN23E]|uniref:adenosylcobinamide-GDP ribazoletransferase n=1 Tax=Shewanella sp. GXUN23E TaxID=3422498 RepID=UPI003D7ED070
MSALKTELALVWVAIGYFTRIPVPAWVWTDQQRLNRASRYFALVGLLVGLLSALVLWLSEQLWPVGVAVILAMVTSLLLTGCFHEDGLADTADGLGGGWQLADKLRIMKDSRIGSYGAASLLMALLLKWQLLSELAQNSVNFTAIALVLGHTLSRAVAASLMFTESYVRDEDSKSKPVVTAQSRQDLWVLLATALLVCGLMPLSQAAVMLVVLLLARQLMVRWLRAQLGGYTGDTLGACQQLAELLVYLVLVALWTGAAG